MKAVITATVATPALLASGSDALAEVSKTPVTVANFVRAESDHMIRANMEWWALISASSRTCASPPRRTTSRRSA
jgi:hypothetical protein